ncbi:CoA transferase [Sulfolobales archaeon HS-7]|nr:CoA transferase [Sulfolobales archaeon HS-7]
MRVVEVGSVIAGPYAGYVLQRLGFEVVKVEPPGGDPLRKDDVMDDTIFSFINRGKKSIVLDLKKEDDKKIFIELIKTTNVVIENLSPGAMERLGLEYKKLSEVNPNLIYCSVKGFPSNMSKYPAFGTMIEAISGVMWSNGNSRLPASITDMTTALYATITVLNALLFNRPGYYEVTLFESAMYWLGYYILAYQKLGELFPSKGDALPFWAPYELFEGKDGKKFYLAVNNNEKWEKLSRILGINEEKWNTNKKRVHDREELHAVLQKRFSEYSTQEIIEILLKNGIPAVPYNDIPSLLKLNVNWEKLKDYILPPFPISSTSNEQIPSVGENTEEILRELGLEE